MTADLPSLKRELVAAGRAEVEAVRSRVRPSAAHKVLNLYS